MGKRLKVLIVALVLILMAIHAPMSAIADFGDFSGDSDYGGSDYGGYDYDYDYDDDDDNYFYFSSSSSSGGGSTAYDDAGWGEIILGLIFLGGLFLYFRRMVRRTTGKDTSRGAGRGNAPRRPMPPGAAPTVGLMAPDSIRQWDPDFSFEEMQQRLSNLYVQMQNCWTAKDLTPLRGDFTDAQFAQFDRQLQQYRNNGQTDVTERIAVLDVSFAGVKQDEAHDILVANISTRITSYVIDDKTGNVVRGNRNQEKFMNYEWTLIRPRGAQTIRQGGTSAFNCPNCNAPININQSAQCPYCQSVVSKSDYDWVISGIKGLSQRTS